LQLEVSDVALSPEASAELDSIRRKYGAVAPRMVLNFARNEKTALHKHFNWDDTAAAERYRLLQAGQIIRMYVIVKDDSKPPIRGLVSLMQDRHPEAKKPGNGKRRHIDDVMSDAAMRQNLLDTALMELRAFKRKYEMLTELSAVWNALATIESAVVPAGETEQRASA
jgi:hypothetical protein